MQRLPPSTRPKNRGFTLTELAIVMSVVGLLLSAVFLATRSVTNNNRVSKTIQQVGQITQNIREYYMNASGITAGCGDITGALDNVGIFPSETRSKCSTCAPYNYKIDSAFVSAAGPNAGIKAGSLRVIGASCTGGIASRFQVVLTSLSQEACAQFLMTGANYQDQSIGITQICGTSEAGATYPCYSGVAANWWPITCSAGVCSPAPTNPVITLAQATAMCASASTSEVAWEFKVRN